MKRQTRSKAVLLAAALAALAAAALAACASGPQAKAEPAAAPAAAPAPQQAAPAPTAVEPVSTTPAAPSAAAQAPAAAPAASPAPTAQPPVSQAPGAPKAAAPAPAAPQAAAKPAQPKPATPAPAQPLPPARALGEIVYAEGEVSIRRGDKTLTGDAADIGGRVLAYDLLLTGAKSRAEVDLGSSASGGALVKVGERTAFYFDTQELDDGTRRSLIRLLSGSLALKVEKLGSGQLTVASSGAVLGVRGTTFAVDASPDGSLLVSCAEGRVACRGADGTEFIARPGTAVEAVGSPAASPGEGLALAPKPLPAERLSSYRASWLLDRDAALAAGGAPLAASLAAELSGARPALDAAYARLEAQAGALAAWEKLAAAGKTFRLTERIEERKAVAAALLGCLKALPSYERPFYRLADLASRRDALLSGANGAPRELGGALPASSPALPGLFAAFKAEREASELRLARIRRALFLFSSLSGDSPLGQFFGEKAEGLGSGGASLLDLDF